MVPERNVTRRTNNRKQRSKLALPLRTYPRGTALSSMFNPNAGPSTATAILVSFTKTVCRTTDADGIPEVINLHEEVKLHVTEKKLCEGTMKRIFKVSFAI